MSRARFAVFLAIAAAAYALTPAVFSLDDAYITLHNARVLITGQDPAYGATAFTGATSPVHVVLVALLLALKLPAARLATALGLVALVYGLWTLARAVGVTAARGLTLMAATLLMAYVLLNALNGLETGWAIAATIWTLTFIVQSRPVPAAILCGLLPAIRPDLSPTALALLAALLWPHSWARRGQLAAIAAVVMMPWFVTVRLDTGSWLPVTMQAKQYWFAEGCRPLTSRFPVWLGALQQVAWQLLPFVVATPFLWRAPIAGRLGSVAAGVTLIAYLFVLPGGLYHNAFRYTYVLMLPWLFLAACMLAVSISARAFERFAVAALVWVASYQWYEQHRLLPMIGEPERAAELQAAAAWVDHNTPAASVLLVHDAGAFSEFSHRTLVDLVGLKTPASIPVHEKYTWSSCGAERAAAIGVIARASRASYLVAVDDWITRFGIPRAVAQAGYHLELLRRPGPSGGYAIYSISEAPTPRTAEAH